MSKRRGKWIEQWDPENEEFRESKGRRIARKNLGLSLFAEHLGFSIWVLWTIVVINLAVGLLVGRPRYLEDVIAEREARTRPTG